MTRWHMHNSRERGLSGSVQVVVLLPALFSVLLLLLQWSLYSWASATAHAAAQEAALTIASLDGTAEAAVASGSQVSANGALTLVQVRVVRGAQSSSATVSGRSVSVLWDADIVVTVTVPTERITR